MEEIKDIKRELEDIKYWKGLLKKSWLCKGVPSVYILKSKIEIFVGREIFLSKYNISREDLLNIYEAFIEIKHDTVQEQNDG